MQPVLKRMMPYRKRIVIGQSFKFTEVILELIVPLLIAQMVDQGILGSQPNLIIKYTVFSLVLAVCGMLCALVCQYNASLASQGYGTDLRNDLYSHVMFLSEVEINRIGAASLTTRINSDIQVLQHAMAMLIRLIPRTPFICIGSIVMVFTINPKFTILFIIAVLIFVLILYLIIKAILPLINRSQQLTDRLTGRLLELLEGIRVIRAVSHSKEKAKQYHWTNEDLEKTIKRIGRLSSLMNPLTMLALNFIAISLLWFSAGEIRIGNLEAGQIIAMINYLTMLLTALAVLSNLVLLSSRSYASALRVSEILQIEKRVEDPHTITDYLIETDKERKPKRHNTISFNQVNFAYPNSGKLLFSDLTFDLPFNNSLGIIGSTGSGKSSLAYLIEKRYSIESGTIKLFECNIDSYSESELLDLVQIVPQSSFLFSGTLRDSLTAGVAQISDTEIWHALKIAQAKDFVAQDTQGLLQKVERGGVNFSGGQKQRLCIARALLRKPRILIFDDSSSALDLATDAALQKALRTDTLYEDTSIITISQRIATVSKSDLILLLDNGLISGFGSHQELLASNKLYQEIYRSQTETTPAEIEYLARRKP